MPSIQALGVKKEKNKELTSVLLYLIKIWNYCAI